MAIVCPARRTYITTYEYLFAHERKNVFKLPSGGTFAIVNSYICSKHLSFPGNFKFLPKVSDGDKYNQRYV